MQKIVGIECRACGCEDSTVVRLRKWRGLTWEDRACENCGESFTVPQPSDIEPEPIADAVIVTPIRCPKCGCSKPPVASKKSEIVRQHKCTACQHSFKSIEKTSP